MEDKEIEDILSDMEKDRESVLSILRPPLPDDYFADKPDVLVYPSNNPLEKIINAYDQAKVKPYISITDQNKARDGETELAPRSTIEIGLSFKF